MWDRHDRQPRRASVGSAEPARAGPIPSRNPAPPLSAHAPSFGYTDYEGDHNYDRENETPGRKRANSLSKFFGRHHHAHKDEHDEHEVRAKLPLATGASSNAAAPPGPNGQVHANPLESSQTSSESGLFSRAARQRRKSAGSASARPPLTSSRQRSASVPPASTPVDRTGYDSRAQPSNGLRRRTGSLPRGAGSEDDAATRSAEEAEEPTTTTALLAANVELDQQPPLFKANFSFRQLQRLERAAHRVEKHDRKQVRKGTRGAEIKIAMGVLEILETERRNKKKLRGQGGSRGRGRSRSRSRGGGRGTTDGEGGDLLEGFTSGLGGLARQLESGLEHRLGGGAAAAGHPPGFSEPPPSTARNGTITDNHDEHGSRTRAGISGRELVAGVGGAAAVVGLVGAGYEWWRHHQQDLDSHRDTDGAAKEGRGRWSGERGAERGEFPFPSLFGIYRSSLSRAMS